LHDSGGYEAEADEIARVADTCAQITAHDAFSVTIGGNRGTENLASLNPALNVCNGAPMTTHVIPGAAATRTRPILFSLSPAGRGWRDAKGMLVQLWFPPHASDPGFSPDTLFERYGIVIAHLPQLDVPCANPPGIGTPADQEWNQAGTNLVFRFRFDCEHAEIYDAPSHLVVADLSLRRAPGNPRKDVYQGAGPISDCPGGSGKVEVDHWSPGRIDVKLEEPNSVDHLCGGIKVGHVIDALTHVDTIKISFVPRRQ
jgi:hypothetical protein